MTRRKLFPQDPYEVFQHVAKNGNAALMNRYTGGRVLGSEYVGTASDVRRGYALGADQAYAADLERQLNRASYSDAVQGMKDAGLNPALMYGQATSPQTAEVPQTQTQSTADSLSALTPIISAIQTTASTTLDALRLKHDIPNIDADTENTQADTEKKKTETEKIHLENIGLDIDNQVAQRTMEYVIKEAKNRATFGDYQNQALNIANQLSAVELKYQSDTLQDREDIVAFQADTEYYNSIMAYWSAEYQEEFMELEKQLREAQVKNERKRYDEIVANIKLLGKKAFTEESMNELLKSQKLTEDQRKRIEEFRANNMEDDQFLKWVSTLATFNTSITGAYAVSASLAGANLSSASKAVLKEFAGMDVNATNTFKQRWPGKYSSHSGKGRKKGEYNEPSEILQLLLGD